MCRLSLLTQTMGSRDWRAPFPVREHPPGPMCRASFVLGLAGATSGQRRF